MQGFITREIAASYNDQNEVSIIHNQGIYPNEIVIFDATFGSNPSYTIEHLSEDELKITLAEVSSGNIVCRFSHLVLSKFGENFEIKLNDDYTALNIVPFNS